MDAEGELALELSNHREIEEKDLSSLLRIHETVMKCCERAERDANPPLLFKIASIIKGIDGPYAYATSASRIEHLYNDYHRHGDYVPDSKKERELDAIYEALEFLSEKERSFRSYFEGEDEEEIKTYAESMLSESSKHAWELISSYKGDSEYGDPFFDLLLLKEVPSARYAISAGETNASLLEKVRKRLRAFGDNEVDKIRTAAPLIRYHIEEYCRYVLYFNVNDPIFFENDQKKSLALAFGGTKDPKQIERLDEIREKCNPFSHGNMEYVNIYNFNGNDAIGMIEEYAEEVQGILGETIDIKRSDYQQALKALLAKIKEFRINHPNRKIGKITAATTAESLANILYSQEGDFGDSLDGFPLFDEAEIKKRFGNRPHPSNMKEATDNLEVIKKFLLEEAFLRNPGKNQAGA